MSRMKIAKLMDLPAVVLMDDMFSNRIQEIHYPAPLMELWIRCTQPHHGSPTGQIDSFSLLRLLMEDCREIISIAF